MLYVISGCSCGGKTTLVDALAALGYHTCDEPGRDVVRSEQGIGGHALPWEDSEAFLIKCVELSVQRYVSAKRSREIFFFDRSLVDAVSALLTMKSDHTERYRQMIDDYRYASTVFMATPWPENFENDAERKHSFEDAVAEYDRLLTDYAQCSYSIQALPQVSVPERVDFVLKRIRQL